jgi:hypothetical protein
MNHVRTIAGTICQIAVLGNHLPRQCGISAVRRNKKFLEEHPMVKVLLFSALTLLVLLARYPTHDVYGQSPTPSGKISIASNSIALAVGVNWGEGLLMLTLKRKGQLFSVDGLTLVDVGIANATAGGEVYNLTDVSQFEGTYLPSEAGFALAGGMGGISMRNKNGVVLHLRAVSEEGLLQIGRSGMTVKLRK